MADKDAFMFLELNDGSGPRNLQVIVDAVVVDLSPLVPTSTCVAVDGVLKLPPVGTKQKVELQVEKVIHVGQVDPAKYLLPKTRLNLEFLRDFVQLRSRTNKGFSVEKILKLLFNHCESDDEGVRNIVAECLGKLHLSNLQNLFQLALKVRKTSPTAFTRATVVVAVKYSVVERPEKIDEIIYP